MLAKLSIELAKLGANGMSAISILLTLNEAEGQGMSAMPMLALSNACGVKRSGTTGLIRRLTKEGLVVAGEKDKTDRRLELVALTEGGRKAADLAVTILANSGNGEIEA